MHPSWFLIAAIGDLPEDRNARASNSRFSSSRADKIPRIDGDTSDWSMVPESYSIGMDQLKETVKGRGFNYDKKDLDVKVKVGWVKGLNRLYFLYEAYDNFWDFDDHSLHNDIFELVVDGDLSGGPLITRAASEFEADRRAMRSSSFTACTRRTITSSRRAGARTGRSSGAASRGSRNCRGPTPPTTTISSTANPASSFSSSGSRRSTMRPSTVRSAPWSRSSIENKLIGMSWAVLDYDGAEGERLQGILESLAQDDMYGNADELVAFRLMPLEESLRKPIDAHWSFQVAQPWIAASLSRTIYGQITSWRWDFGDGKSSD